MKKIICILAVAVITISCTSPRYMDTHRACWYVKNTTDKPIKIPLKSFSVADLIINPGDSDYVYAFNPARHLGTPSFKLLYDMWDKIEESDQRIDILSMDGELLKTWRFADKNAVGRQLFNESYWELYTKTYSQSDELNLTWVFDILPQDIAPL